MIIFLSYLYFFITSTVFALHIRSLTKKKNLEDNAQIRFSFEIIFILFLGSLVFPFFSPFYIAENHLHIFLLALTCGVFGAGYNLLKIVAQKHIEAGITNIVLNIYTPITIILSSIFLHEGLTPMQIAGTFLLLVSILIISKKHRMGKFSFDKYFLWMLLSGILLGVLLVAERALQKTTGFSAGTMLSWGSQALGLGLATLFYKSKHTYTASEVWGLGITQFLSSTGYVILVWLVANLSLVASITTFKVVIIFISAAIFLHEREDLGRKIFGSILAVAGLLLMK